MNGVRIASVTAIASISDSAIDAYIAASRDVELQPYDENEKDYMGDEDAPRPSAPANLELALSRVEENMDDPKRASCILSWNFPLLPHYVIRRNGNAIGTVHRAQHSFEIHDMEVEGNAVYDVVAVDAGGLFGPPSYALSAGIASSASGGIHLTVRPTQINGASAKLLWNTPKAASEERWTRPGEALNTFSPYERDRKEAQLKEEEKGKGDYEAPDAAAPGDLELELNRVVKEGRDPNSKRASTFLTWKPPGPARPATSTGTGRSLTDPDSLPSDRAWDVDPDPDARPRNFVVIQYI
eukprot:tig00020710_g13360.t2